VKEFQLIHNFFKPLTQNQKAARGLIDDVAQISDLVISKDIFVEDVHFLRADGGFKIASKLLRTNLSDLAAAGATPLCYMLGFSKNEHTDKKFLSDFSRGLKSLQDEFSLYLIGGDTVKSEKLFFSITIFGKATKGKILSRNAAKDGDLIYVSGTIGDAYLGRLELNSKSIKKPNKSHFLERHFFPTPRIKLGKKLIEKNLSRCAIDISDGLLADLNHLCKASKLGAQIALEKIPFSQKQKNPLPLLSGGDDYELIFAVDPKNQRKISALAKEIDLDLTCIGNFTAAKQHQLSLYDNNKKIKLTEFGYEH
jgi:thiamine-monophosphate kinase